MLNNCNENCNKSFKQLERVQFKIYTILADVSKHKNLKTQKKLKIIACRNTYTMKTTNTEKAENKIQPVTAEKTVTRLLFGIDTKMERTLFYHKPSPWGRLQSVEKVTFSGGFFA